ncbi:C6 zinc finger domain-containing protein [Cordyceps javanica]|uniref:C6 zinc finger domain-containing protein n=1 Tax=Cordyceps javanica TaxID=43265 RepID=A0A545ULV3_9HYPO|nr:C6 zinc finger domain-containing protein [Cordyceps javanica]TQW01945.1 C6 zinc finger domain protein [Cordyceps javanica]
MAPRPRIASGPADVKVNLADMTMFDALRFQIAGLVAGSFDHAFWTVDVLRACQVQPAIWHASLALMALHQSQRPQTVETFLRARHEKLSMTHSTAAIRHVIALTRQRHLSQAERETLLLASLLLAALSTMQGDLPQAVMHSGNCIQLFHQWRFWEQHRSSATRRGSMLNADSIGAIIAHVELQLLSRLKHINVPPWGTPGSPPKCSDVSFRSSTDAYHEFQPLFTSLVGLWQYADMGVKAQPRPQIDMRHPYLVEFQRWKVKFDALRASGASAGVDAESMLTLHLHWHFMHIGLTANIYIGEVAFDEFLPVFRDLVVEAGELLRVLPTSPSADMTARPAFSFTMSVVEGLFWAGHGCRDPATRRDILHLIKVWPRREGIWDNSLMAAMLETSIGLEENAWRSASRGGACCCTCVAGSFICNDHRINNHIVEFLPGGRARVTFETVGDRRGNKPGFVTTLP